MHRVTYLVSPEHPGSFLSLREMNMQSFVHHVTDSYYSEAVMEEKDLSALRCKMSNLKWSEQELGTSLLVINRW